MLGWLGLELGQDLFKEGKKGARLVPGIRARVAVPGIRARVAVPGIRARVAKGRLGWLGLELGQVYKKGTFLG